MVLHQCLVLHVCPLLLNLLPLSCSSLQLLETCSFYWVWCDRGL